MTRNAAVRFCQNNLASAAAATVSVSSSKTGFPSSYAFDSFRFRRWITTGCFRVTSSNKTLYINDGSNKTVTLTEGTYATGALLAAHIQTQLNASSTNWTVTYSTSTYKFTVGRSSGTATLRFTQTTNAAWDMLGYLGVVDTSVGTGTAADAVRTHTSERMQIDLGSSQPCTAFLMIGPAGEDFSIPVGATVTLKADDLAANLDSSPALSLTLTPEATGIFKFLDDQASYTYRHWRIDWIDRTNPNGPEYQICQVYLGDYVTFTARNLNLGFERQRVDPSKVFKSQSGVPYWSRRTKFWSFKNLNVDWLEGDNRTELERILDELGTTTPFFIALDPTAAVSDSVGEFTKYVTFDEVPPLKHLRYTYHGVSLSVSEVVG